MGRTDGYVGLMNTEPTYQAETRGFIVRVRPEYLPERSDPDARRWVWAYRIEVVNASTITATLRTRRWEITDALGQLEIVEGEGVVGEQPTLHPGEAFSYVSGCPLTTPSGAMVGRYQMEAEDGERFEIDIPAFSLDVPGARRTMN